VWIAANLADLTASRELLALFARGHIGAGNPLMAALLTHGSVAAFAGYTLLATLEQGAAITLAGVKRAPTLAEDAASGWTKRRADLTAAFAAAADREQQAQAPRTAPSPLTGQRSPHVVRRHPTR
jgi:hypothetical protein